MNSHGYSPRFRNKLMLALTKVQVSGEQFDLPRANHIYLIGNGGSATVADHIACDMVKFGYCAHAMTDGGLMSMAANDETWAEGYGYLTSNYIGAHDVLIAISSSGQSANILKACEKAYARHADIITLSGFEKDNPLRELGKVNYYVPSKNYGVVEITHLSILHAIVNPGL